MGWDGPSMDTSVGADIVKPTGSPVQNGTPGKAPGNVQTNSSFGAEGISSDEKSQPWPSLPQYWNVNGTARDTDVSNRQP